ncbi:MAG: hypothetical protein V4596_12345 [Bdellovibrionota bacterium]
MKKIIYGFTALLTLTGPNVFAKETSFSEGTYASSDTLCELQISHLSSDLGLVSPSSDCDEIGIKGETHYPLNISKNSSGHSSKRDGIEKRIRYELLSGDQILVTSTVVKLKTEEAPEKVLQFWRKVFVKRVL